MTKDDFEGHGTSRLVSTLSETAVYNVFLIILLEFRKQDGEASVEELEAAPQMNRAAAEAVYIFFRDDKQGKM